MKRQLIRLTESDLHRIVENSVRRIISEGKKDYSKLGKRFGKLDGEDVQECGLDKNGNPCYIGNNPNKGRKTKKGYKFSSYGDFKPNEVKESLKRNRLHRIVENSVRKTLKEGGNLATYDDNGKLTWTNSKDTWRGVKGTKYIWHGEWSDPEIWYNGELYNANDIEDGLWEWYKEYCQENNEKPTDEGYEEWVKTEDLEGYLMDVEYGMYGED